MKFLILAITLVSASAQAAKVVSGKFNEQKQAIELEVAYGGGCKEHKFSLDVGSCLESYPVQCVEVKLVDHTVGDNCEAYIHRVIELPLNEQGLDDPYYNGAALKIHGDANSEVFVRLPFFR